MTNDVIIIGNECLKCKFGTLVNENDARNVGICCSARDNKYFHWGASVPCDLEEKKREE